MPTPILTLTTDFGLADHYVGTMKGVILSICPRAQLVDISHQVTPYAVAEGAYVIEQAYRYFPPKTVHLVVVDPGVGSARRPILLEAAGQYFVAPDNGVLATIFARERHRVRLISNEKYFLPQVSSTFHGRDIFAPVAAHLAAGVPPARIGKLIADYLRPQETSAGRILKIDRFGNIVTSFRVADYPAPKHIAIARKKITAIAASYAAAPKGLFLIAGSAGYWEISRNQSSAAAFLRCLPGAPCQIGV